MRVVFMGTPLFAVETLKELFKRYEVVGVFTNKDKPYGRRQIVSSSEVKKAAVELGLNIFQPARFKEEEIKILKELEPDFIVVAAYGKLLPKDVLLVPKYGCFNVHGSLLPKYRGASPIQSSIINCEEVTGISIIKMTENLDDGDIYKKVEVKIGIDETYEELSKRLAPIGAKAVCDVLEEIIKGEEKFEKQDEDKATYVYKITKEMAKIDFNLDSLKVHKRICGFSPWPCAYCLLEEKMLKIYKSKIRDDYSGKPGEILDNRKFIVGCKEGAVEFLVVQLQGRKKVESKDFLNGFKLEKGSFLE